MEDFNLPREIIEDSGQTCTIQKDEVISRSELIDVIKANIIGTDLKHDTSTLQFKYTSSILHSLMEFGIAEQSCCSTLTFSIKMDKSKSRVEFIIEDANSSLDVKQLVQSILAS